MVVAVAAGVGCPDFGEGVEAVAGDIGGTGGERGGVVVALREG